MSNNQLLLLNNLISSKKEEIAPEQKEDSFFEYFTAHEILKNEDLSIEEIQESITDGSRDGGIDSFFFFVDGVFISDEMEEGMELRKSAIFRLVIIQASIEQGFKEQKVIAIRDTVRELFDLTKNIQDLEKQFNADICRKIDQFRTIYVKNTSKFPVIEIEFYYVNKSIDKPHPNVVQTSEKLKKDIKNYFTDSKVTFKFISAPDLWGLASKNRSETFDITLFSSPISTSERDAVFFVELKEYFKFITNESGDLRKIIFEANVRDYQGNVEVNRNIESTLEETNSDENFWWLNNGITIICSKFMCTGNKLTTEDPQIVNGLQTSNQIYNFYSKNVNRSAENRHVLIRIINPQEDKNRDKIIKATNSQTAMLPAQLMATDQLQKDIEAFFIQNGLFYDRRKNFHKNQKKPIEKIIGISALSQAVHAILNQKPHEARAKPASLIKESKTYELIFNKRYDLRLYFNCAKIMKQVDKFMKSEIAGSYSKDLKYHLATFATCLHMKLNKIKEEHLDYHEELILSNDFLLECLKDIDSSIKEVLHSESLSYNTFLKRAKSTEQILLLLNSKIQ